METIHNERKIQRPPRPKIFWPDMVLHSLLGMVRISGNKIMVIDYPKLFRPLTKEEQEELKPHMKRWAEDFKAIIKHYKEKGDGKEAKKMGKKNEGKG